MSRTREFEVDDVLERAMQLFWARGYEATSIQDLVDATGINRASLYQTFGDKRHLYLKALERFGSAEGQRLDAVAPDLPLGLERIRAALNAVVETSLHDSRGCLLLNATAELAAGDPEVCRRGREARVEVERFFHKCLTAAEADGSWRARRTPASVARFLTAVLFGVRTMSKLQPDRKLLRDAVETALEILK